MTSYREAFRMTKEEVEMATPPGTSKLVERDLDSATAEGKLQLVPQPSHDPADPLNWPMWRKIAVVLIVSLYAFIGNWTIAILAPALPSTVRLYHPKTSYHDLTRLVSISVLMAGASNMWWVPLANCYGRRPIMLIAMVMMTLSTLWCAKTWSFNSMIAARFFQACGAGAADTIAPDMVGEVLFVHQRGRGMAVYTFFLAVGSIVASTAGGYISHDVGPSWIHWSGLIQCAFITVAAFFFMPETMFDRGSALANEANHSAASSQHEINSSEKDPATKTVEHAGSPISYPPYTFTRSLSVTSTNRGGLLRLFFVPYLTLRYPGVWMVMLHYGGFVGGIVTMATIGPAIVSAPPYLWGAGAGLISVGGIVGCVLGWLYTYAATDWILRRAAAKNKSGFSEPEVRLPTMIPSLFLVTSGLLIYGLCAQNPGPNRWVGLQVGNGMLCFAIMQAPSVGFNYLIEAYNAVSGDCFLMVTMFRAVISFAWTFFVAEWVEKRGAAEPFGIFTLLMGIFSLLLIPMWLYGKRTRIATAKWLPEKIDH